MGFDLDIQQNLAMTGTADARPQKLDPVTHFEWLGSFVKTLAQPISLWCKIYLDQMTDYKPACHLNNLFNANMNNAMAIDYANKIQTGTDGVLSRWTQEFPRTSPHYKTKRDQKPWGEHDPIYFDHKLAHTSGFKPGVWHYCGMPLTDHHDFCGFENAFENVQTVMGT